MTTPTTLGICLSTSDMTSLPKEHPQVNAFMEAGRFSVQMSPDNAFGRIPVYHTIKQTVNKDTPTVGGTRSFSLNPGTPGILHDC